MRTVSTPEPPEPFAWGRAPSLRERALSAVGTPVAVGATLLVGAIATALVLVLAQPHAAEADGGSSLAAIDGADPGEAGLAAGVDEPAGTVFVHVVGEVASPGVVELPAGARVQEAIDAAGGPSADAVLAGVNLARVLVDGEQLVVPDARGAEAALAQGSGGSTGPAGPAGGLVNLNTADVSALQTLPGVGPALSQRIVAWREANGGFRSVEQLIEVSGIGAKSLEGVRELVTV